MSLLVTILPARSMTLEHAISSRHHDLFCPIFLPRGTGSIYTFRTWQVSFVFAATNTMRASAQHHPDQMVSRDIVGPRPNLPLFAGGILTVAQEWILFFFAASHAAVQAVIFGRLMSSTAAVKTQSDSAARADRRLPAVHAVRCFPALWSEKNEHCDHFDKQEGVLSPFGIECEGASVQIF